ncbi:hypothetical protein [Escherichia phage ZH4]|nr:hypothetical protein [Escherichia phage ZH4]
MTQKAKGYKFPVTVTGTVSDPLVFETNGTTGRWGNGETCTLGLSYFEGVNNSLQKQLYTIKEDGQPQVLPASSVPPVTVKREVLTIDKIGVGQTFIVHGKPEEVYVKISNSHVFNHKLLQMHTTDAQRFQSHLNLVVVELVVYNGK